MKHALVTGASGFIGFHLVRQLSAQSVKVTCLVRQSSNRSLLEELNPEFAIGDVTDRESIEKAMMGNQFDVVFHLAGLTKSLDARQLMSVNQIGTRNVAASCAESSNAPTLIVVSSLSAAGPDPSSGDRGAPYSEQTVSDYGKSKRAGELAALGFASKVPMTILRPPIVLGEADHDGLTMYKSINRFRTHLVPCFFDKQFSVIHASDLANACILAAKSGKRARSHEDPSGIYFAAADEVYSYADLGRVIASALGRKVLMVRFPSPLVWGIAGVSEFVSRLRGKPSLLNLDKAREATSGSWTCSSKQLREDTGFVPEMSFDDRIRATVAWYRDRGWL